MADRYTHAERIGQLADRLDNLAHALQLPLPPAMHVEQLRAALPEIRDALRLIYTAETGDDPWSTHPRGVDACPTDQPDALLRELLRTEEAMRVAASQAAFEQAEIEHACVRKRIRDFTAGVGGTDA